MALSTLRVQTLRISHSRLMRIYMAYDITMIDVLPKRAKILAQANSLQELVAKLKKMELSAAIWSSEIVSIDDDSETMIISDERFIRTVKQ